MDIASYSKYSNGVKNVAQGRKLLKTRSRAPIGSFVITRGDTNIDPNALLMRKDNGRIFRVNKNDVINLMRTNKYSSEKAIAYYEAVCQIPHLVEGMEVFSNSKHPAPSPRGERTSLDMPSLKWYANTWDSNSWVRNMLREDGGPPCFWTKDHAALVDPFSKAWRLYDDKFPDRGWRVTYDIYDTYEKVTSQLLNFLEMHENEEEVHIWIQGSLKGLTPEKMVSRLKVTISQLEVSTSSKIHVMLLASGSGKTYLSNKYESVIDIDDIYSKADPNLKTQRDDTMKNEEWSKHDEINAMIIENAYDKGDLDGRLLVVHVPQVLTRIPHTVHGKYKMTKGELLKVLDERKDDFEWAKMTKLNWNTSQYSVRSRDSINDEVVKALQALPSSSLNRNNVGYDEYKRLWDVPITDSYDLWELYGSKNPVRIPVIPWRVSNLGMRVYDKGLPPQLFPPSSFCKIMNIDLSDLDVVEIYGNYSDYVKLIPMDADSAKKLDFGWREVGRNLYSMIAANDENYSTLLMIEDPSFFNGCGSVVTSAHACFGLGRSSSELLFQFERKVNTGHSTSGHMIASVLAFQSHFLWYLEEVFNNFSTKTTTYETDFIEPESGSYHTIHEYRNAIHDMEMVDNNKLYPKHARINFGLCKKFVAKLQM